jgi:hypothetical protein
MKNFFIFLAASFLIISCRNSEQANQNTTPKLSETDSLIKKFAPIINGEWVRADYVKDLKKTLSPWHSYQRIGEDANDLSINTKEIAKDSLSISVSFGGAGATYYVTHFNKGKLPNTILLEHALQYDSDCLLGFDISQTDTTLILYLCDNRGRITNQRKYLRAYTELSGNDSIPSMTFFGLSFFHNKLLVAGKYGFLDSLGRKHTAQFDDLGKVTGIGNFRTYYVMGVFGQGPGDDTDAITFDLYKKTSVDYLLKIYKDSLYLYTDTFNDSTVTYGKSKLAYKLIRQK